MCTFFLNEYRCSKCNKLLSKGVIFNGILEIKCLRCAEINKIGNDIRSDMVNYLLVINNTGTIDNISGLVSVVLGYEYVELIGKNVTLISPNLNDLLKGFFDKKPVVINEKDHFNSEHITKDGKKIPLVFCLKKYELNLNKDYIVLSAQLGDNISTNIV